MLVVDDNAVNRRILHDLLLRWKMRPTVVDSGAAALRALTAAPSADGRPFALVLLDANMPEMDGFEVARRIRDDAESARRDDHDAQLVGPVRRDARSCRDVGIATHLTKPVDQRELLSAIGRVAGARAGPARRRCRRRCCRRTLPERRLHVLLAEDNVVNQRLAATPARAARPSR